jgi:hypothetical protein
VFSVIKCFTDNHGMINCVNRERLLLIMRVNVSCTLQGKLTARIYANHCTRVCRLLLPYVSFQFPLSDVHMPKLPIPVAARPEA